MSICGGFGRVFQIGPVFRAEESDTCQHLCEFTGLDVEMEIKKNYAEVMDMVDRLFVKMFDYLNENCSKDLEAINKQYPFEKLQYSRETLKLTFEEGVQMLREDELEINPFGDLNKETERRLGQLVKKKYKTDFYILHRYPLVVRPFYTMPCHENPKYSNSFDVFIRGITVERIRLIHCTSFDCLEISGPNLKSFDFHGVFKSVSFKNCPVLAKVKLCFSAMDYRIPGFSFYLVKSLSSLPVLEDLHLQAYALEGLVGYGAPNKLPIALKKLRNLHLSDMYFQKIEEMSCVLFFIPKRCI